MTGFLLLTAFINLAQAVEASFPKTNPILFMHGDELVKVIYEK